MGGLAIPNFTSLFIMQAVPLRDKIEQESQQKVFVGYRYSVDNQYRFAKYQARVRDKVIPCNGKPPRYGQWRVTREWEENAGHQTIVTPLATHEDEEKKVIHHSSHAWGGLSSHNHTHFEIFRHRWDEQWTVTTDFDGNVTKTPPERVGQVATRRISQDRERGWTSGYRRRLF
jgi:hypothetical protein